MTTTDLTAQEDARRIAWNADGTLQLDGPPANLRRQLDESFVVRLDWQVNSAGQGRVAYAFGGIALDITALVSAAPKDKVSTLRIPLRCFADGGAKLDAVTQPLQIRAGQGFVATLRGASIEGTGETIACPPKVQ